ncbi:MAG: prepilin-type N-terminal cleavage/methylation domain-containing protein [Candidatus Absconditabacterales bacterium]|nr:prepilin-type N-terminal cleavage/methylation domain-containing protein [Candidatus Absconditabacterales bacterium]
MIKRGVTLLELLVVIVVVGILFTMMFRVYGTIVTNTNRVNQIVLMQTAKQDLYLHLTLFLQGARFDPERHSKSLVSGYSQELFLRDGQDRRFQLLLGARQGLDLGPCESKNCLVWYDDGLRIPLLDGSLVFLHQPSWYMIPQYPHLSGVALVDVGQSQRPDTDSIFAPGVWLFATMYPTKSLGAVAGVPSIPIQFFFNL